MAIVRELVTRLSFAFDKTNLVKFEQSIIGFKTKFALAATAIGASFKKVTDYAIDFSDQILKTDALAKFSGTTIQALTGLQNAFAKFNIPVDVFQNAFQKLTNSIKQAAAGEKSPFFDLVRQSQGAIQLIVDGQITTTKNAIDQIRAYLKTFTNEAEQIRAIQNIFDFDLVSAHSFLDIVKLTGEEWQNVVDKETKAAEGIEKIRDSAKQFKGEVNNLGVEFSKFANKLAQLTFPALTSFFKDLNNLIESFETRGFFDTIFNSKDKNRVTAANVLALQTGRVQENLPTLNRIQESAAQANNNSQSITNNNNFDINVAPGTTEDQAHLLTDQVSKMLENMYNENVREIINNNPQVE